MIGPFVSTKFEKPGEWAEGIHTNLNKEVRNMLKLLHLYESFLMQSRQFITLYLLLRDYFKEKDSKRVLRGGLIQLSPTAASEKEKYFAMMLGTGQIPIWKF